MVPPLLFAHRGASLELPENTLPAFRLGLKLGASVLETDVHVTRDGHPVLAHDPSGYRMAGEDAWIRDCTLAQIKRWDAGRNFVDSSGQRPFEGKGFEIPTLEETLAEFPEARFNIDIKPRSIQDAAAVLRVLGRAGASHRVRLASFHSAVIRYIREEGYPGGTSLGSSECAWLALAPAPLLRMYPPGTAAQIPTRLGPVAADTPAFLDRCHRLGLQVHFWTINDPEEARRLLALGADGIMTDDPRRVGPAVLAWPRIQR
ncbi:MAG: glycerophosphodiester phosphodiesterase [Myxococcales bacterium]|nr:glycerophosphodiester phosphodiesterase [Polyangiaceae bacterium]MDW8249528.1 glycerophosphodiester phosphodiesterase [Myxococcales bacterium]